MRIITFCFIIVLIFVGCSDKKVEITSEYIINENWNKKKEKDWGNKIEIYKLKVKKDSIINPFIELSQVEILPKLEVDSTFYRYAAIRIEAEKSYGTQPIYFNKYNGFYWNTKEWPNNRDSVKTIGDLQKDSWYRFSELGLLAHPYYIYVYVDSSNSVHRFDVNLANY
jgi:hypothetical protein